VNREREKYVRAQIAKDLQAALTTLCSGTWTSWILRQFLGCKTVETETRSLLASGFSSFVNNVTFILGRVMLQVS
jgi:hypothetical protein